MTSPPLTRRRASRRAAFHPLRVAAVDRLTDDAVSVTFEVPQELRDDYAFAPGQHLTIRHDVAGAEVRRNYSLCAPAPDGPLRVAVKRLTGGSFSSWANRSLRPGAVLDVMTPTGRFGHVLDAPGRAVSGSTYCAIAAGSGITPVISIVATVLAREPEARVTLVYGNRTTADVMFLEELHDLKDRHPTRFQLVHVLSREPLGTELFSGRIDRDRLARLLADLVPPAGVDEWFLCGPYEMVAGARATLLEHGVAASSVHTELFHVEGEGPRAAGSPPPAEPAEAAGGGAESSVTVSLDGRTTTLALPRAGRPVLDALLAVRPDAPYACKGGVCGTCRAMLVEGEVRMERNFALEQDELDAGYVLACQSHPTTGTVVLDFDA